MLQRELGPISAAPSLSWVAFFGDRFLLCGFLGWYRGSAFSARFPGVGSMQMKRFWQVFGIAAIAAVAVLAVAFRTRLGGLLSGKA